jgi:hypothetical protein
VDGLVFDAYGCVMYYTFSQWRGWSLLHIVIQVLAG